MMRALRRVGWLSLSVIVVLIAGCAAHPTATPVPLRPTPTHTPTATHTPTPTMVPLPTLAPTWTPGPRVSEHQLLVDGHVARGVNLGNALEAPVEGEWGMVIEDEYLALIAEASFTLVRVPIRWSAHALEDDPYTIDPAFFERVDHVIEVALDQGLIVVINMHHYDGLTTYGPGHEARFLAMWRQIAERYADYDDRLYFEPLNEPHGWFTSDVTWSELAAKVMAVIRESNPTRQIVLGPANWNALANLYWLELPPDDNLIVTFHYYDPHTFTHQGAEWVDGSQLWLGQTWEGTAPQTKLMNDDLDMAVIMANKRGWTLFMGEFGVYDKADMDSRELWTRKLRQAAEARGIAWAYWEFGAGFGVYDRDAETWREPLRDALLGD